MANLNMITPQSLRIRKVQLGKKGYILASFIFYHNVLHRFKVLAPKHWWKITLSSRAARHTQTQKKKKSVRGIFKIFHLNWHTGIIMHTEENTLVLHNSLGLEANDASVKFPYNYSISNFMVNKEISLFFPLIVAPIEDITKMHRKTSGDTERRVFSS